MNQSTIDPRKFCSSLWKVTCAWDAWLILHFPADFSTKRMATWREVNYQKNHSSLLLQINCTGFVGGVDCPLHFSSLVIDSHMVGDILTIPSFFTADHANVMKACNAREFSVMRICHLYIPSSCIAFASPTTASQPLKAAPHSATLKPTLSFASLSSSKIARCKRYVDC